MSDGANETAVTPAAADTSTTDTATTTTVDDGIIDFDAVQEETVSDIEDGNLDVEAEPEETPEAAAEAEAAEAKKKLNGSQRAKIREARLLEDIAARDRELETLRKGTAAPAEKAGADPKAPREEDFNGDFLAFNIAKAAYDADKSARAAVADEFKTREARESAVKEQAAARIRALEHEERVDAAKEVITDFDAAMEGMKGVNVRDDILQEIISSKNSAVITYHFAKNPSELDALQKLSPREVAREMGRLEATLKLPELKKATKADAPLSKVKGGAAVVSQEQQLKAYLDKKYPNRNK